MSDSRELQAKLIALSNTYAAQLPEKLKQLEQALSLVSNTVWDEQGFQTFAGLVHSLIGSGKTFGFSSLSKVAHNLETYLRQLDQEKAAMNKNQRDHILGSIRELHQASTHRDAPLTGQSGLIAVMQPDHGACPSTSHICR